MNLFFFSVLNHHIGAEPFSHCLAPMWHRLFIKIYNYVDFGSHETKQTFLSVHWFVCVCLELMMPYNIIQ
jgi:hypothetical protein